jgi:hypothetical protein
MSIHNPRLRAGKISRAPAQLLQPCSRRTGRAGAYPASPKAPPSVSSGARSVTRLLRDLLRPTRGDFGSSEGVPISGCNSIQYIQLLPLTRSRSGRLPGLSRLRFAVAIFDVFDIRMSLPARSRNDVLPGRFQALIGCEVHDSMHESPFRAEGGIPEGARCTVRSLAGSRVIGTGLGSVLPDRQGPAIRLYSTAFRAGDSSRLRRTSSARA